jgi:hypothetical protein
MRGSTRAARRAGRRQAARPTATIRSKAEANVTGSVGETPQILRGKETSQRETGSDADEYAASDQAKSFIQNHSRDLKRLRAEGHADTDLVSLKRDCTGHHAEDIDRHQDHTYGRECTHGDESEPRLRVGIVLHEGFDSSRIGDRDVGIQVVDHVLQERQNRIRIAPSLGHDDAVVSKTSSGDRVGEIDLGHGWIAQAFVLGVRYHSDNFKEGTSRPIRVVDFPGWKFQYAADRIFFRKNATSQGLIDDDESSKRPCDCESVPLQAQPTPRQGPRSVATASDRAIEDLSDPGNS